MNLLMVLQQKANAIIQAPTPFAVTFTEEDFLALTDIQQLRAFKMSSECSIASSRSTDLFQCKEACSERDLYRVLEFCTIANPAVRGPVGQVFPGLRV